MTDAKSNRAKQTAGQILSIVRREGIPPGARLVEQRLADVLGVSRGPVRAGLQVLAETGLVWGERNRGFVLADGADATVIESLIADSQGIEPVYRAIADDRLAGRLPQVVSEAQLARQYGLARPQLLRLLDRIAAEGWIERLPGYGWRFAETLSEPAAYEQTTRFRSVIEPAAILEPGFELATDTMARLRLSQKRLLGGALDTLSLGDIFQIGCEFHEELARGSRNPFYVQTLRRVNSIRRLYAYRTFADREGIRRHIGEHLRLLDLLEQDRREEAARLMRRHLRHAPGTNSAL